MRSSPLVLSPEQCRRIDRYAIETLRIPGDVLMENAGRNVAEHIHATIAGEENQRAVIFAGKGNNGGDGFVIARHLLRRGWDVTVYLAADPAALSGDAAIHFAPLERLGIPVTRLDTGHDLAIHASVWEHATVVVDALLGTGFAGPVREPPAGIIRAINALRTPRVVAVDIPSGLDAMTGRPGGVAVEADETVTFLALKPGFLLPSSAPYVGNVSVADIGVPLEPVLAQLFPG